MTDTKTSALYWRTGDRNVVHGPDIASAMTLAGFGGGSVRALDFYANGDDTAYAWDKDARDWVRLDKDAA